ncbi:MAG: histidine phosphatase family protein [Patescibacteria group bacterium]|nr:histidine phosphatase family protein [Patescibacteria group bacterium]
MRIYFIRHGETTGDVENRYGGNYDDHLTEKGRRQAEKLAEKFAGEGIAVIYSSPFFRAKETAEILAKKLNCSIVVVPELRERSQYGVLTGMVKSDACERYPSLVEKVKDRLNIIEGAESYEDFSVRIQSSVREIIFDQGRSGIAIVWHGGPMRVLFREVVARQEIGKIADCAFLECEIKKEKWIILRREGISYS